MNRERFFELLDAYGGDERAWPADERAQAKAVLADDAQAQAAWQAAHRLDSVLDAYQPPIPDLSERILETLPRGPLERFFVWLFPGGPASLLRPAVAASVPLILGVVVGVGLPVQETSAISSWETQERLLMDPLGEGSWYDWDE